MADNLMADGVISLDDRPAQEALKRSNTGLDQFEQKAKTVLDRTGKEWEVLGGTVVRVSGNSKTALDRLTASMERQAQMAGKSGVDKLIAERDQLMQRWAKEPAAIEAITRSYERRIAAEQATIASTRGMEVATDKARLSLALMGQEAGVHVPRQLRGFIAELPGVGRAMSAAFSIFAVVGLIEIITSAIKKVIELREEFEKVRKQPAAIIEAFQGLNLTIQTSIDELSKENNQIRDAIAKLEHRPQNLLALALDDARIAADKLAESLKKDVAEVAKLISANSVGWMGRIFMGREGTGDIEKWFNQYQQNLNAINFAGNQNVHRATTPEAARAAQAEWDRSLAAARRSAEGKLNVWTTQATTPHPAGKGTIFEQNDNPAERESRLRMLQGIQGYFTQQDTIASLRAETPVLQAQQHALEAAKLEADRSHRDVMSTDAFERRTDRWQHEQWDKRWMVPEEEMGKAAGAYGKDIEAQMKREVQEGRFDMRTMPFLSGQVVGQPAGYESSAMMRARMEHDARMSGMTPGMRPEDQAADQLKRRLAIVESVRDRELASISDQTKAAEIRNKAEVDSAEARYQYEEKITELQKRQHDEIAKESAGLWNTLFTHPGKFGSQLGSTVHGAILRPITEGLGNMTANVLQPVVGGIGNMFKGLFGGQQDPAKVSTDMNTQATVQNSAAVMAMTVALSGFMGMGVPAAAAVSIPSAVAGISMPASSASVGGGGALAPIFGGGGTSAATPPFLGGGGARSAPGGGFNFGSLKNFDLGGFTRSPGRYSMDASGNLTQLNPGHITSMHGAAGAAMFTGGMMAAQHGLMGRDAGTGFGILEGAGGGAMIGMSVSGPLGAAIGAGVGAAIGIGEMAAGVESPQHETVRLVRQIYGFNLGEDSSTTKQIIQIAQSKYGGRISMAVRSQEARQLLQLYSQATGQKSAVLTASTVHAASLVQSGGVLGQQATYVGGTPWTYASNLPTIGPGGGNPMPGFNPFSGPVTVQVSPEATQNLWASGTAAAIAGNPTMVSESANAGDVASSSRLGSASTLLDPWLLPA